MSQCFTAVKQIAPGISSTFHFHVEVAFSLLDEVETDFLDNKFICILKHF